MNDIYKKNTDLPRVFNFSGGKTSAYMTIHGEPDPKKDIVLFTDTGREHPLTYKFIQDFEKHEGIKVHKTELIFNDFSGFDALISKEKNSFLPNRQKRICTSGLKILPARRYLKKIGINKHFSLIGFRADEEIRVKKYKKRYVKTYPIFPLYDDNVSKHVVNEFWKTKSYNLEIPAILGNCDLCFIKGQNAIISILKQYPELSEKWIHDEKKTGQKYIPDGLSYSQMLSIAKSQMNLFDLNEITPSYSCKCSVF